MSRFIEKTACTRLNLINRTETKISLSKILTPNEFKTK